ncbi:MAG TPA: hypothetical protein VKT82_16105 [Ktedonobacterales bacterium]|nr:hypothetical protein [Ktedonobacterales bacterium]
MAFLMGQPKAPSYPSGRYIHTNPLRREGGLRLLTQDLPEPLRWAIIRAWRQPVHFDGNEAIQSVHRQRPDDAQLARATPRSILLLAFVEMEVARRVVEAPQASILPATRNNLLLVQGVYLRRLYLALARHIGEATALAEFQRLILQAS